MPKKYCSVDEEFISKTALQIEVEKLQKQIKNSNQKIENLAKRTEKVTDRVKSFRDLKQELKALFSVNRFSEILNTSSFVKKVFFLFCMVTLFVACMFYVTENCRDYRENNVLTQIKIKESKTLIFPGFTICLYDSIDRTIVVDFVNVLKNCYYENVGNKCFANDFESLKVTNARRGDFYNCYKFNGGKNTSFLVSTKFGKYSGLTLNVTLSKSEIMFYYVGDNRVRPVFSEFTNFLQTGKSVFIGIIKKNIRLLILTSFILYCYLRT